NGAALLLRREVTVKGQIIKMMESHYYGNSMDNYLNNEFWTSLPLSLKNRILTTTIEVAKSGIENEGILRIPRKIFLLSITETGFTFQEKLMPQEGKPLKYFEYWRNRIAYTNGQAMPWLLRTPNRATDGGAGLITTVGGVSNMADLHNQPVRSAFCLDKRTPITVNNWIVSGETVYVLAE
ncbi:MAG: DUF6273 domain-containing protein, partial [Gracilibacteraceae bacterium]|nr:DUF6273 domain-containing protein [Gracilibacteraceae bacterium]